MDRQPKDEELYTFKAVSHRREAITAPAGPDLSAWLTETSAGARWLLAHTYSGVVWGRRGEAGWAFSRGAQTNAAAPAPAELLMLRAFGPTAEVFVWRVADGLHARRLSDVEGATGEACDEAQVLWGTKRHSPAAHGFSPLADGEEGLVHAPPLDIPDQLLGGNDAHRPARLYLRHYLTRDKKTGLARIEDSRLFYVGYVDSQEAANAAKA